MGHTYAAGWRFDAVVNEVKDLSIETLRRQAAESRQLLGLSQRSASGERSMLVAAGDRSDLSTTEARAFLDG